MPATASTCKISERSSAGEGRMTPSESAARHRLQRRPGAARREGVGPRAAQGGRGRRPAVRGWRRRQRHSSAVRMLALLFLGRTPMRALAAVPALTQGRRPRHSVGYVLGGLAPRAPDLRRQLQEGLAHGRAEDPRVGLEEGPPARQTLGALRLHVVELPLEAAHQRLPGGGHPRGHVHGPGEDGAPEGIASTEGALHVRTEASALRLQRQG
mmetsp:Transcript_11184/g.39651  ORF Transcript_11184/g.39651 Transcript_11184/m.39651 type:complete len:212 (+) Transcript_11184:276-911(+)